VCVCKNGSIIIKNLLNDLYYLLLVLLIDGHPHKKHTPTHTTNKHTQTKEIEIKKNSHWFVFICVFVLALTKMSVRKTLQNEFYPFFIKSKETNKIKNWKSVWSISISTTTIT
jgi:hypothetical protein